MTDQSEPEAPAWGSTPAPPPPPPPYGLPAAYQQVTGQQTHQGALWSMILGIVGLVAVVLSVPTSLATAPGVLFSPIAFGLGLWASKATAARPDLYNNRGQAVAGWIMGLIGTLLAILGVIILVLFLGLIIWIFTAGAES